ncbi:MAG: PhnD/SsuA/transferrin family substrate-binding protein [Anaerolineae bacterium]|nr:PhnD/SsuA/transferrin family substrate-binding protein [Anaerolineae bacterium]
MAACGGAAAPTAVPTITPTPRSTPLPMSATAIPLGNEERPLRLAIVADEEAVSEAIATAETALLEQARLAVEFVPVETQADAIAALCASPGGTVTAAWLNGLGYAAAQALGCGDAALVAEHRTLSGLSATETINLVVAASSDSEAVSDLIGGSFCRISATDSDTWLIPSILLQANGVDPLNDLDSVEDYDDIASLLAAVASGDCDAAAIPQSALDEDESAASNLTTLASVDVVRAVLVYPQEVNLTTRDRMNQALTTIAIGVDSAEALQTLIGSGSLRPAEASDFESLDELLSQAGIDLEQFGTP